MNPRTHRGVPTLRLLVGPDPLHCVGVVTNWETVTAMLRLYATPGEAWRAKELMPTIVGAEFHAGLIHDAVCEWNRSCFADDDGPAYVKDWRWCGIRLDIEGECVSAWAEVTTYDAPEGRQAAIQVDEEALDSEARRCAVAALEALRPLRKPVAPKGKED